MPARNNTAELTAYELQRQTNIDANNEVLMQLGLYTPKPPPPPVKNRREVNANEPQQPSRHCARISGKETNYVELNFDDDRAIAAAKRAKSKTANMKRNMSNLSSQRTAENQRDATPKPNRVVQQETETTLRMTVYCYESFL